MEAKYLTIKDICNMVQVSRSTVNRWIQGGKLRSTKIGRLVRISSQDLGTFIEGRPSRKRSDES